eukprot:CAMPEP_0194430526 /NCGR_PEP_ID=MMETSP0176-20130528/56318_1 /TAXON_ID=216777 /ORGANISM="Proboscia alata, Strain PI-D3" /LENGTH=42 /DNA_ID= /DNA_START= /DNA_END= /DNA_ORIENTATION=
MRLFRDCIVGMKDFMGLCARSDLAAASFNPTNARWDGVGSDP